MAKGKEKDVELEITPIEVGEVLLPILGTAPLLLNRLSEKVRRELLVPHGRLTTAERRVNLKHDPEKEFRDSAYRARDGDGGLTRILFPSRAFKRGMEGAALDMPTSISKAQVKRLVYVCDEFVPIWGLPQLHMRPVQMADQSRTPDIRTRAFLPQWASFLRVRFAVPMLTKAKVFNLQTGAGMIGGIGDDRVANGGSFGTYIIVEPTDKRWLAITKNYGLAAQDAAFADPVCSDVETEDLLRYAVEKIAERHRPGANDEEVDEAEEVTEAAE